MSRKGENSRKREWKRDFQEKEIRNEGKKSAEGMLVAECAAGWISSLKPQIKESTYVKYCNILRIHILPWFGKKNICSLSVDELILFCNTLLIHGGRNESGLAPKTVSDILSILRSILRYAQSRGLAISCTGKEVVVRRSTGELQILSLHEQKRLCAYLSDHLTLRNFGLLLCLFTGLRIGELCALRWEDIALENRELTVCRTVQRLQIPRQSGRTKETDTFTEKRTRLLLSAPKSSSSVRTIPLPENIARIIERSFKECNGYVLTGKEHHFLEPRTMQNHFKRVLRELAIPPVNFHALRHTFATRCVEVGFDIKSLSEILGHSNVNITMNRYVHPSMTLKKQNMEKLSNIFPA